MTEQIFRAALLATLLAVSAGARADRATLQLRPVGGLQAGHVKDGAVLLTGYVTSHAAHAGFQLRCDARTDAGRPQVCLLYGQRNPGHELRVRMEGPDWQAAPSGESGAVARVPEDSVAFRLVADGDQTVTADAWTVGINAAVIN